MMNKYQTKLLDPRWQRKRLGILQNADWKCQHCNSRDKTLQVHHGYYRPGANPWDYEDTTLWCLCRDCHEEAQAKLTQVHREIAKLPPLGGELHAIYMELRYERAKRAVIETLPPWDRELLMLLMIDDQYVSQSSDRWGPRPCVTDVGNTVFSIIESGKLNNCDSTSAMLISGLVHMAGDFVNSDTMRWWADLLESRDRKPQLLGDST